MSGIIGLDPEFAMMMIDRIRMNARDLEVKVQPDGCTPNFLVIFSGGSQATLQSMVERNPALFQFLEPEEKREMLAPAPVHVFTNILPRTRDGMPIAQVRNLVSPPVSRQQMAHSKLYTSTRRDIVSAMVIFDRDEVGGMSVGQLADYATMRGLAQTRPPQTASMRTILSLFNPSGPYPEGLTDFDRAYLRSLYGWIANLPAHMKLGRADRELSEIDRTRADRLESED